MIIVLINIDRKAYKKFCPQNFLYENRLMTSLTKDNGYQSESPRP